MKRKSRRFLSVLLVAALLLTSLIVGGFSVFAATPIVITTDAVRLRSSASIESDNTITTLGVEETLTLLENSSDGWAHVSRNDGTKGYCSVDYLSADPKGSTVLTGTVNVSEVNFRKEMSTSSSVLAVLPKNTKISVLDNTDEYWIKAEANGSTGYIYRTYVDLVMSINIKDNTSESTPNWFESSALEGLLGDSVSTGEPPAKLFLSSDKVTLEAGKFIVLSAFTDESGTPQSAVSFTSSNTAVVAAYKDGTIKGLKTGTATVTAALTGTDLKASCKVTVTASTAPTEPETTVPTEPPADPVILSAEKLTMRVGNHGQLTANKSVTWSSSDTSVVTVSGGILSAKAVGKATVTASAGGVSASCEVTVSAAQSGVTIKKESCSVTAGKTYYNGASSSSDIKWKSSNEAVAVVENGFITAISPGKAVITAYNSTGEKTCLVTVLEHEPVRFAYSAPNTASPGETITLYAVTDKTRTGVQFKVTINGTTSTINATNKITDGNTFLWTATTKTSTVGTHKVVAYAKGADGTYKTCSSSDDGNTTIFIRANSDKNTATLETRRGTNEIITMISEFEGYCPSIYFDTLANNIPTLGYGRVVYIGESFYNDMTKREAYAYLVQTVNNGGYTDQLNKFLDKYEIKRNQQQFDALLSFVYNLGTGVLSNDTDFRDIFLATGKSDVTAKDTDAYINASGVNFRKEANTSSQVLAVLDYGTPLTLLKTEAANNWYYVQTQSGTKGYVYADYVTKGVLADTGEYNLDKVNRDDFTKLVLQYHHAGPGCVWGLLYRRVDELDVFYYGEYVRNGRSNKYDYSFTCPADSSTYL